jgi:CheY-like chemotaxis protein
MLQRDLVNTLRREGRQGPLVLIADDSPTMRVVTRHARERAGLQTLEVATPLEVSAAVGKVLPEIFMLDITFAAARRRVGTVSAALAGISRAAFEARQVEKTLLKQLPTLAEIANAAALLASDHAGAVTGAIANVTCGEVVDS